MHDIVRRIKTYPALTLAIGGAVLWGVTEFMALQRSQLKSRVLPKP